MIRVGVGGWTFPPWRGVFYPAGLVQALELEHASRHVTGIEVNGTFYRTQTRATFERWAAAVPDDFVFSLKAPRYAVSRKLLAGAGPSIDRFITSGIAALGPHLGPILWQMPPTRRFDAADMAAFLDLLPGDVEGLPLRHAIEVRHQSFRDAAFYDLVRQAKIAIVCADSADYPEIDMPTADFTYARLQRSVESEPAGYEGKALRRWAKQARAWAKGDRDVFIYFIAGAKVRNPAAAAALLALL